jgi:TRAP-type C4-dicarboxylate transport system substrate-binding protein
MFKRLRIFFAVCCIVSFLSCSVKSNSASETGGGDFPEIELSFSSSVSPAEANAKGLEMLKNHLAEQTGNKVKLTLHLQSSLYKQEQEVPAILKGNLSMCFSEAPWLVDYMPDLAMYGSGYLFASLDHWKKFYASELALQMFENVAQTIGVRPLGTVYLGARLINLTIDKKVLSRADLKNIKLRMPSTDAWLFLGEALGSNPVPLPYADLYLAMQTKTVDGQDNPIPSLKNASFYEVTKSATLTNHVFGTNWVIINEKMWQGWSSKLRQVMLDGVNKAALWINETNEQGEKSLIPELESHGMKIYQLSSAEISKYRQEVLDYYFAHKEVVGGWDMEMHRKIQDLNK